MLADRSLFFGTFKKKMLFRYEKNIQQNIT